MALAKPSYTHTQTTAATTWTIAHGLGLTEPVVDVYITVNGTITKILPKSVQTIDMNTSVVTFSSARTGTVVVQ
jgi:hypothetical protein